MAGDLSREAWSRLEAHAQNEYGAGSWWSFTVCSLFCLFLVFCLFVCLLFCFETGSFIARLALNSLCS